VAPAWYISGHSALVYEKAPVEIRFKRYHNNNSCMAFCTVDSLRRVPENQIILPLNQTLK
jgi:hypothetical protein